MKNNSRFIIGFWIIIAMLLFVQISFGAAPRTGSWTETNTKFTREVNDQYRITTLFWTADSTGAVPTDTTTVYIKGLIFQVVTDPDTSAVPAIADSSGRGPTANYDITLTGSGNYDVMNGALSDRSSSASQLAKPRLTDAAASDTTYIDEVFNNSRIITTVTNNKIPNARGYIHIYWKERR